MVSFAGVCRPARAFDVKAMGQVQIGSRRTERCRINATDAKECNALGGKRMSQPSRWAIFLALLQLHRVVPAYRVEHQPDAARKGSKLPLRRSSIVRRAGP